MSDLESVELNDNSSGTPVRFPRHPCRNMCLLMLVYSAKCPRRNRLAPKAGSFWATVYSSANQLTRALASDSGRGQSQSRMHFSLPGLKSVFTHANLCRTKARPVCRVHGICPVRATLQPPLMSAHPPQLRPFWLQRISRRSRQRLPPGCKRHPYAAP